MSHHTVSVAQYKAFLANRSATSFDEIEQPLVHVRDWAFATGGARPLCKFGRTASDGSCASGAMYVWAMLLGDAVYQEGVLDLGWQEIHLEAGGYSASDGPALSGTPAALGIYLHVLGDRLSHGLCLDDSPIRPATGSAPTCNGTQVYELELRFDGACGQVTHAVRHYLETGHGSATPARSITGLNLSARELAEWSRLHQLTAAAPRPTYPAFSVSGKINEEFVRRMIGTASAPGRLVQAIGESCANRRLAKLCALARDGYGIEWYDGNATCTFPTFPGDRTCPAKAGE